MIKKPGSLWRDRRQSRLNKKRLAKRKNRLKQRFLIKTVLDVDFNVKSR